MVKNVGCAKNLLSEKTSEYNVKQTQVIHNTISGKGDNYINPEANKYILHSNNNYYESYEVPYNPTTDDIAWDKMKTNEDLKKINNNTPKCGIFLNAVYHCFSENVSSDFNINFADLTDNIKDKVCAAVVPYGDINTKLGQTATDETNLVDRVKRKLMFRKNNNNDNSNNVVDEEKKIEDDSDDICRKLLVEWKLGRYIDLLIEEKGYDDIDDWPDLEVDDLVKMGFKEGHAKRFMSRSKQYFLQKK